jgi:hypothetical protein
MNRPAHRGVRQSLGPPRSKLWSGQELLIVSVLAAIAPILLTYFPAIGVTAFAFTAFLVWRADLILMPSLLLISLAPRDFYETAFALNDIGIYEESSVQFLKIAAIAVAALRVLFGTLTGQSRLREGDRKLLMVWLLCLVPAIASSIWGHALGNENWTRSVRFTAAIGIFFYGILMARSAAESLLSVGKQLVIASTVLVGLANFGLFGSHILFFLVAICSSVGMHFVLKGQIMWKIAGGVSFGQGAMFAWQATFTFKAIFLLAAALYACQAFARSRRSMLAVGFTALATAPLLLVLSIVKSDHGSGSGTSSAEQASQVDRISAKITGDRGPLWSAAMDQIAGGPYLLAPSGRAILVPSSVGGNLTEWTVGAHNTLLEVMRNVGPLVGLVCVALVLEQLRRGLVASSKLANSVAASFGAAAFAVGTVGISTGDYPLDSNVALWLWSIAGVVYGLTIHTGDIRPIRQ